MESTFNVSILIREFGKPSVKLSVDERIDAFKAAKAILVDWLGVNQLPSQLSSFSFEGLTAFPLKEGSASRKKVVDAFVKYAGALPGGLKGAVIKSTSSEQELMEGCEFVYDNPTPPPPVGHWECGGSKLMLDTTLGLAKVESGWQTVPTERAEVQYSFGLTLTPVALVPKVL